MNIPTTEIHQYFYNKSMRTIRKVRIASGILFSHQIQHKTANYCNKTSLLSCRARPNLGKSRRLYTLGAAQIRANWYKRLYYKEPGRRRGSWPWKIVSPGGWKKGKRASAALMAPICLEWAELFIERRRVYKHIVSWYIERRVARQIMEKLDALWLRCIAGRRRAA